MNNSVKKYLKKKSILIINQRRIQSLDKIQGNNYDESLKWSKYFNRVVFLCFSETTNSLYKKKGNNILITIPFKISNSLFKTLTAVVKSSIDLIILSKKIIKLFKIDLLRPENIVLVGFPIFIVGKITKKPIVNWYIGNERNAVTAKFNKNIITRLINGLIILLEKIILNSANHVITLSEELFNIARSRGVKNIIFSPNSIDISQFKERNYDHLKEDNPKFILLFSGRLDPEKNVEIMMKAIKILSKDHKNFKFQIVGDGVMKEWILSYIKKENLEDIVKIHGYIEFSKMPEKYQESDIFLLPSQQIEGMSAALMEAMCSGCACIATPVGQHDKLILHDKTGSLIKVGDVIDLVNSIKILFENPDKMERYGKNARKLILNLSKNYYKIHGTIYKKIIELYEMI